MFRKMQNERLDFSENITLVKQILKKFGEVQNLHKIYIRAS